MNMNIDTIEKLVNWVEGELEYIIEYAEFGQYDKLENQRCYLLNELEKKMKEMEVFKG